MLYTVIGALDGNVADAERKADGLSRFCDIAGRGGEDVTQHDGSS